MQIMYRHISDVRFNTSHPADKLCKINDDFTMNVHVIVYHFSKLTIPLPCLFQYCKLASVIHTCSTLHYYLLSIQMLQTIS